MVREAHELLDGSRPIPIDKITYELSQNIILAFDNNENINNKNKQIEIEARIGMVLDKNKNRLKLPINTDAIIESNYSDFKAGIDKEEFEYLLNYLNNMTIKKKFNLFSNNEDISNFSNAKNTFGDLIEDNNNNKEDSIYEFVALKFDKSVDKYYIINNNNTRIRVTTSLSDDENQENESMVKSLYKENINTWNIYLGNNNDYFDDDDEEENYKNDSIDYRISINIEHTKPISKLYLSKATPVYERFKERTTFLNKYLGIQLDLTKIKTKNNELYEIEIEIPSKSILKAMSNLRNKNDSNYLHFICSNLVNNVRGICSHLNYLKSKNILKYPNDTLLNSPLNYSHPPKEKKKFKKYIHDVLPIVGDYMYRVVAKNEKNIRKKMKDNSISNYEKMNIFKNLIDIRRQNKKSLKRISENYVENKWKIINRDSKIEIVLQSDEEENDENKSNIDIEDNYKNENYDNFSSEDNNFNDENNNFNIEDNYNFNNKNNNINVEDNHNFNSENNFYDVNFNENSNQDNNNNNYKEFYNDI
ncbi:RNA triphosphatase, putative [Plasmodium relictum]|uniref:mRNA 5'-phosphatase n=1 Tax=Plasmodium relictum TaxID=85471 RepID=A0A1J1H808_PLARL|nr:RNA triphosphatase, putative [Plasmodium relictum]CRG99733.1 RNA triphosphatase, putative [Plasmodium relictum]